MAVRPVTTLLLLKSPEEQGQIKASVSPFLDRRRSSAKHMWRCARSKIS